MKAAAVLMYCLGLSYDAVACVLDALGAKICKGSAYHYVYAAGQEATRLHHRALRGGVRVAGQDTTVFKVRGRKLVVAFVTDALSGRTVHIELLRKEDAQSLQACLQKAAGSALELLVSDDADAYKAVADHSGIEHQVCTTHMRKALISRAQDILRQTPPDDAIRPMLKRDVRRLKGAFRLKPSG